MFQHACKLGAEGIVSKRLGSRYRSGAPDWLKSPRTPRLRGEAEGGGTGDDYKQGQKVGSKRASQQRFPYEPRVVGGRLRTPAELQAIHRYVTETPVLEAVTEEIRVVLETVWPELISKLPPKL